jgi:hypothetical protein
MLVVVGVGLLTVNGALSPGFGITVPLVLVARITTPVSALLYVVPEIVTLF